ncbi:MAG: Crp/Fnr family transcriptional regulator [Janthinobacterium lividum]
MQLLNSSDKVPCYTNKLLQNMSQATVARLCLRPVSLPAGCHLESPGSAVRQLVFPEAGVACMTTTFEDGSQAEVGLYGYDSVIGLSTIMGSRYSLNRIYMQVAGHGFAARLDEGRAEFLRGTEFQQLALAFLQSHSLHVAQTAGCNARHTVEQRLARWLLNCADRSRSMTITISQEDLATMIGVRRMSAVMGITHLKNLRLIDHRRGQLLILDRQGLEDSSCECYRVVRDHLDSSNSVGRQHTAPS